jgi:thioesterase domain-containing protein/acyl carrier protein
MEKRLVAYIVPNEDPTPSVDMLRNHLKAKLPDYMIPSVFVVLEKFPLTPNGKIDRKGLTVPDRINIGSEAAFVAPRDTLELQLTNIWKEILGVENIGIKDNFFELGGDSLLAAQLFAKIEEILGENLPLATILQTPTIEQLANIFREKEWKSIWSSLVAIQSDGSKPPLFLIHGAEGNVLLYRKLAQYLGPDQPVFGLQSQGLDGKKDYHTRIESMAANYIKEIRSLQFEGPYYLGGYCMGGTVAYEMAQQLRGKGQKTALLVMLETHNMQFNPKALSMRYKVYRKLQNIKFHLENLLSLSPKDKSTFFFEKANVEISRFKVSIDMLISKMANKLNIHKGLSYPHVFISKVNDQAQIKYLPKVYKGRITIFRPKKCFAGLDDPQLGWGKLTDLGLDIHDIPVNPKGMLVEPFVQLLGNELKDCINKAVENGL